MGGDYQPGQEAFYYESGTVYKVEVLKNNSDAKWEKYSLKVMEVINSGIFKPPEVGEVFECEKKRGVNIGGLWYLLGHNWKSVD